VALARIVGVQTARSDRTQGAAAANARAQFAALAPHIDTTGCAVISGASGVAEPTRQEAAFLAELGLPVRATATAIGHGPEPSFPASLALAAMAVQRGTLFAPLEATEAVMDRPLWQALVTSWGLWRGEAMALVGPA
jgi:3-oxoacyl-[acyl-carrier-protein] synthase II